MGVTTKYTCDNCGHEQDTDNQMWRIGLTREGASSRYSVSLASIGKALWCRKCMIKMGMLPPAKLLDEVPPDPEPTFEDQVRAFVGTIVDQALDDRAS